MADDGAPRLRLEDAEAWAGWIEQIVPEATDKLTMLRALIALARAAKREVRCTCDEAYTSRNLIAPDCLYHSLCIDTAAELERWE